MTPQERFAEIAAAHPRCFWLDGGGGSEWSGRRSLMGWLNADDVSLVYDGTRVTRHAQRTERPVDGDIFEALERELDGDPESHWIGYFGYTSRSDLPGRLDPHVPTAIWMRAGHLEESQAPQTLPPAPDLTRQRDRPVPPRWYADGFEQVQAELHAGNSYEVNLTYREELESDLEPVAAYLRLREHNPAPYAGYLQHHRVHLLSSSPERYAVVDRHRWLETRPIKGTTPRGSTPEEDARLAEQLRSDPKTRAENLMIVDLLRNDVAMVCEPGTVDVPGLMEVESYPSVHQLVTTVRGRLREEISTVAALRALFPAGSMTGAPKLRTMEIIDRVESTPRGVYAGAFGWISGDGRADLGVVIRSLVATPAASGAARWRYRLGTGGGITVASDLVEEYAETHWKSERLWSVLDPAIGGHSTRHR